MVYLATGNPDACKTRFTHMINYFQGSLNTNGIIHQCEAASTNVSTFPKRIYNPANTVHSECVTERTDLQETICLQDDCILWHFSSIWISKTWIAGIWPSKSCKCGSRLLRSQLGASVGLRQLILEALIETQFDYATVLRVYCFSARPHREGLSSSLILLTFPQANLHSLAPQTQLLIIYERTW